MVKVNLKTFMTIKTFRVTIGDHVVGACPSILYNTAFDKILYALPNYNKMHRAIVNQTTKIK